MKDLSLKGIIMIIDTDSLVNFFSKAPSWGTKDKPLFADNFCTIDAPQVSWKGGKVMVLEPKSLYKIKLTSSVGTSEFFNLDADFEPKPKGTSVLEFTMITDEAMDASKWEEEWKKFFKINNETMTIKENQLFVEANVEDGFVLQTKRKITSKYNLQYMIRFSVETEDGMKYAMIDPFIDNYSQEDPGDW